MKIAYLTNCFGIQSHTFIRREIAELRKLGVDVSLFGIRPEISDRLTTRERALVEQTTYLYPLKLSKIIGLNLAWMLRRPGRWWPALAKAMTNGERSLPRRLKLIYHFFVAAYLAEAIERAQVEHVHAHFMNVSATMAMYVSLLTGIPYSITVHSAGTRNAPHIIGIPMKLRHAQFLMMISRFNIEYFDQIYPCRDKATVVRCGMDLEQYPYRDPQQLAQREQQRGKMTILAVGRLVEKKGFHDLVEAMELLKQQHVQPKLEILGNGPLEQSLKHRVKQAGLEQQVHFFGPASTEEVRQQMLDASVVVVPSVTSRSGEMEGIPVVIMEAMALGVPVIATRHSGIPELVRDGETGTTVPEKQPAALAEALQGFDATSGTCQAQVMRARQLIEREFNITVVAAQRRELFLEHQVGHQLEHQQAQGTSNQSP